MVEDTPPDFQDFYIQFHTDSGYQMEHILFPLDGTPAAEQQNDGDFRWTREEWKMHSMDHFDPGQFTVRRDIVDSTLITEYIRDKNRDRKSTRLNSSHVAISYAVSCLKK